MARATPYARRPGPFAGLPCRGPLEVRQRDERFDGRHPVRVESVETRRHVEGGRVGRRGLGQTLAGLAAATLAVMGQTDEERITPGLDRLAAALSRGAATLGG